MIIHETLKVTTWFQMVNRKLQLNPIRKCPDRLCSPYSLLFNGYWCSYAGGKWPGCDINDLSPFMSRLRMSGGMPLLHPYVFLSYTGQLYLHLYMLKTSSASSIKIYVGNDHEMGAFPTSTLLMVTAHFSERLVFKFPWTRRSSSRICVRLMTLKVPTFTSKLVK